MTQFQPPYDMNYSSGPLPSPRPSSVTVLSIFAIIIGSLLLLCNGLAMLSELMMIGSGGKNPFAPNMPAMNNQAINTFNAVDAFVKLILAGFLLAGGIGGLGLRPWARRAMVTWSIAVLVWATLALILQLAWVAPAMAEFNQRVQTQFNPQMAQTMSSMQKPVQLAFAVFAWVVWCILPVCFLLTWRSPRVVGAFQAQSGDMPPGGPYPPQYPPNAGYGA
jgi:hypothetical protein